MLKIAFSDGFLRSWLASRWHYLNHTWGIL